MGLLCLLTGCQSLHPFTQRTQARLQSAREWANGGLEAFQSGKLQQAKGFFARAAAQSPTDFRVRANLARTLHQSGETAEAISHMQQAVEQSGGDPAMIIELGGMYLATGQLSPATREVQAALSRDQRFAPAWQLQGRIHQARGDQEMALADFQKAIGIDPQLAGIHQDIVSSYLAQKQPLKAFATVEQWLAQHPIDSQPEQALLSKSDVLLQLNQNSTAVALLERASHQYPDSDRLLVKLAVAQLSDKQYSPAGITIARGREAFPQNPDFERLRESLARLTAESPSRVAIR